VSTHLRESLSDLIDEQLGSLCHVFGSILRLARQKPQLPFELSPAALDLVPGIRSILLPEVDLDAQLVAPLTQLLHVFVQTLL
jgi:hypothetical protein